MHAQEKTLLGTSTSLVLEGGGGGGGYIDGATIEVYVRMI